MRVFTDTTGIIKDVDGKALKMFGDTTVFQFFVDDATRRTKVYPMKRKTDDEYLSALKRYITEVGQPVGIVELIVLYSQYSCRAIRSQYSLY
jgi:hypothetical protein